MSRRPTHAERDTFLLKVIAFRGTLSPVQQRMLDAMAVAAFCESPGEGQMSRERLRPHAENSPWLRTLDAEV